MVRKYYSGYLNYCFTTFYKDKKFVFDFVPLEGYTRGILYLNREEDMEALEASEEFKSGEPYNVSVSNFMNKETTLQKAQEVGVSSPNLQ